MSTTPATWAAIGAIGAVLLLGAAVLWIRHGEQIFVQMLLNGFAGCLG
ncbi:hypothetical protein [Breoghania sp.]|nr:hypothetical protein [Breoghania sp.]